MTEGKPTGGVAMESHEDAVAGSVVLQSVAVDEVTAWSTQRRSVDRHQSVARRHTAPTHVQLLSVVARRHPQVLVGAALQRVEVD